MSGLCSGRSCKGASTETTGIADGSVRMDRFWLKQYPPGTPADIDPNEYPSLKALIEQSCKKFAGSRRVPADGLRA